MEIVKEPNLQTSDNQEMMSTCVSFKKEKPSSSNQMDKKRPYACTFCDKTFTYKNIWSRHIKTHDVNKCSDGIMTKPSLLNHKKINIKPRVIHKCEQCIRTFTSARKFFKHKKIHLKHSTTCNQNNDDLKLSTTCDQNNDTTTTHMIPSYIFIINIPKMKLP